MNRQTLAPALAIQFIKHADKCMDLAVNDTERSCIMVRNTDQEPIANVPVTDVLFAAAQVVAEMFQHHSRED